MARETTTGESLVYVVNPGVVTTEAFAFEQVTVSTVSIGFTPATYDDATVATCYVTGANIRVRYDGGDPTTALGIQITDGDSFTVNGATNIGQFRMIRDDAVDATVVATFEHPA